MKIVIKSVAVVVLLIGLYYLMPKTETLKVEEELIKTSINEETTLYIESKNKNLEALYLEWHQAEEGIHKEAVEIQVFEEYINFNLNAVHNISVQRWAKGIILDYSRGPK